MDNDIKDVNEFKWRKKPAIVEAYQWKGAFIIDEKTAPDWLIEAWDTFKIAYISNNTGNVLEIEHIEGKPLICNSGDYIIRDEDGDIYSQEARIFENSYTKVSPAYIDNTVFPYGETVSPDIEFDKNHKK